MRVAATPHQIALGTAIGVFTACTPFLGLQMALAAAIAFGLRGSIPAALMATFVGNPLSWPAIWTASYIAGAYVLGLDAAYAADHLVTGMQVLRVEVAAAPTAAVPTVLVNAWPLFRPLVIGGTALGLCAALLAYYPTWRAVRMFQQRRVNDA